MLSKSTFPIEVDLKLQDVILTSGCSHALEMCINCLADPGDNILLPQPGFSLYVTLCQSLHIEPRYYKLKVNIRFSIASAFDRI